MEKYTDGPHLTHLQTQLKQQDVVNRISKLTVISP